MGSLAAFVLIWGVWLLTPIIVDGVETVMRLLVVRGRARERAEHRPLSDEELPRVSVIVPAHNEAEVIDRCLNSIKNQDYPHGKLEVIVVDDGSTDETAARVEEHVSVGVNGSFLLKGRPIRVGPFSGTLALIKNGHQGKAHALNAGLAASTGELIVNIDSDVVLGSDAVRNIANSFGWFPEMGAATGNIEVDWELLEARDDRGELLVDDDGELVPRELGPFETLLARCQFFEYLSSFDLGRRAQAVTGSMYTLAGACSVFRREVLTEAFYSNLTVSEDTCLTFDLHRRGVEVGFIDDAKAYVEPTVDVDDLYAQRVRWTRGQLEVCGLNRDMIASKSNGLFGRFELPRLLLFDHTLAFPRLIWAPLLLFFPAIGYPVRVVALAGLALYLFYLVVEVVMAGAVYSVADEHTRERIEQSTWVLAGLPLYRFVVFHYRFSGFLVTLTEEQRWSTPGPMRTARRDMGELKLRSLEQAVTLATPLLVVLGPALRVLARPLTLPLSVGLALVVHVLDSWQRSG